MTKKLFIDDERFPNEARVLTYDPEDYDIVRTYREAIRYIDEHKPQHIAFDHDLGIESDGFDQYGKRTLKTGYDVAKWLVGHDEVVPSKGYITKDFSFTIHSANPIGAENIKMLLDSL
ncbi:MAG: cyclic-phosphate processing receiver domain-containing protein [Nanoarchaeota archaeon]